MKRCTAKVKYVTKEAAKAAAREAGDSANKSYVFCSVCCGYHIKTNSGGKRAEG